jgi:hypothetical protein
VSGREVGFESIEQDSLPEKSAMSIDITEESILEALHRVPREDWHQVLAFLQQMEPTSARPSATPGSRNWTASELLAMPPGQRDAILEAAAALAEADYRNDPDLTDFEAFGPDDLYVDDDVPPTR